MWGIFKEIGWSKSRDERDVDLWKAAVLPLG